MAKTWKVEFKSLWGQDPPLKLTQKDALFLGLLGSKAKVLVATLDSVQSKSILDQVGTAYRADLTELDLRKLRFWLGIGEKEDREMIRAAAEASNPNDLLKKYKNENKGTSIITEAGTKIEDTNPAIVTPPPEAAATSTTTTTTTTTPAANNTVTESWRRHGQGRFHGMYGGEEWSEDDVRAASSYYGNQDDARRLRKLPFRPRPYQYETWKFKRTVIVGDLHGCGDELEDLLKLINFKPLEDRLISVGDVVDRGPKISKCFEILREYKAWCCLGNHEEPFLKWLFFETHPDYKEKWSGKNNPIDLTSRPDQSDTLKQLTRADWRDMCHMQLMFKLTECKYSPLVVHAGLFPGQRQKPEEQDPFAVIRMINLEEKNGKFETLPFQSSLGKPWWEWYEKMPGFHHVVYGHSTSTKGPRNLEYSTGLDTGAVYGGLLTALIIPPPGTDGTWKLTGVKARSHHWVSSAAELSGGQKDIIGTVR